MLNRILRGFLIAIISAIIISFVTFIFSPYLPFNIFTGFLGILFFAVITSLSFIVYLILPPESSSVNSSSPKAKLIHSQEMESSD
ncbi:MAG: hypothetical protein ACFFB2_07305 [Promethearchaeota archaeon]